jgi:hypothetical protein
MSGKRHHCAVCYLRRSLSCDAFVGIHAARAPTEVFPTSERLFPRDSDLSLFRLRRSGRRMGMPRDGPYSDSGWLSETRQVHNTGLPDSPWPYWIVSVFVVHPPT